MAGLVPAIQAVPPKRRIKSEFDSLRNSLDA